MNESATIEEEVTRTVAVVDWTDECEVRLHLRKRDARLTPDQARAIASALTRCAEAADRASASAVRPVKPSPSDLVGLPQRMVSQIEAVSVDIGATVLSRELLSPDCAAGKHPHGWRDTAWDDQQDIEVPCECPCHTAGAAA